MAEASFLERRFRLRENGTDVRREVVAGVTTFLTMAYIIFVNPGIVSSGIPEMPFDAVMMATVIASVVATLIMALYSNYPFALAPGMGLNAYFTYSVVGAFGIPWQTALGAVFISGVISVLLTATRVRETIVNAVPASLKAAIAAGIGLFIAFIGLRNSGIIVSNSATAVGLGDLTEPSTLLAVVGILLTGAMMARGWKGSILIGIAVTAAIGWVSGIAPLPEGIFRLPSFSQWAPVFGKLDIAGALGLGLVHIVFAFLFVDIFDTVGTLIAVASQGGFLDKDGKLPRAGRAMVADSLGTVGGAIFGTPTVTSYIESAAGVAVGGRTGLVGVVVAALFLLSLFFTPLVSAMASTAAVTAPALVVVGSLMIRAVRDVAWDDPAEGIAAFIAMLAMPLTYSIATGIALGFITYPIFKLVSGKGREVHWLIYVLAILFALRFALIPAAA